MKTLLSILGIIIFTSVLTSCGGSEEIGGDINVTEISTACDCVDGFLELNQASMKLIGKKSKREELDENEKNNLRLLTDKLVQVVILSKKFKESEFEKCPNSEICRQTREENLSHTLEMDGKSMEWWQKI